jgi:NitT/TauT family transport system substrate-binding protein
MKTLNVIMVCLSISILAACAVPGASSTAPAQIVKLKVGYSTPTIGPSPVWIAKEAGFFSANGLDVELVFIDGGTKTAQALIANSISFAAIAPPAPIDADAGGADLVIIAGLVNTLDQDFVVVPEIKTGADIKGKKVAINGPSSSSATAMRIALRQLYKLDPDRDVEMVALGSDSQRATALISRQISATVLIADFSLKAQKEGMVLLDSLWDKNISYQGSSIAARSSYLNEHPDVATCFVKSIIQAIGFIRNPDHKSDVTRYLAKYLSFDDPEVLESAYVRSSRVLLRCAPYVTLDGMKTVMAESKAAVERGMTPEQLVNDSIIKTLDESGFVVKNCK